MATASMIDLIDAHDIIHEDQDLDIVLAYAEELKARAILRGCSEKTVQTMIACVNSCLHCKKASGKTNGLVALQVLVQDCSDQVFLEQGANWIKAVYPLLQKSFFLHPGLLRLACSTTRTLVLRAPQFPEISRYLTTLVSPMIDALLNMVDKHPGLKEDAVITVQVLFQNYPGSCGSAQGKVEKFLVSNITPSSRLQGRTLARCLALMPRLGGGGKEGIHHKANFVTMFQRLTFTLEDVLDNVLSLSVSYKHRNTNLRPAEPFQLVASSNKDLFSKTVFMQGQFDILADCIRELLKAPFPHPKSVRPGLLFNVILKVFEGRQQLSDFAKTAGSESKIILFVLPQIMISCMKIMRTMLTVCRQSLILYVSTINDTIIGILSDLRNFTEPFDSLRMATYDLVAELCDVLGAASALEKTDFISYALSDILPPDQDVATLKIPSSKKAAKKAEEPLASLKEGKTKKSMKVVQSSLKALGAALKAVGSLLDESVMKQVQCVLLGLGLEQEFVKPMLADSARRQLYETLILMLEQGHCKSRHSMQLFAHLFRAASSREKGHDIKYVCHHGLSLCMSFVHPSRSSMHLDLPMSVKTTDDIRKELMKVHVFYMETSRASRTVNFAHIAKPPAAEEPAAQVREAPDTDNATAASDEILAMKQSLKERTAVKRPLQEAAATSSVDDDDGLEALPSKEESERIINEVYDFSHDSIYIPEGVKNRVVIREQEAPEAKQAKLDESDDEFLDTETMMKDFVPV